MPARSSVVGSCITTAPKPLSEFGQSQADPVSLRSTARRATLPPFRILSSPIAQLCSNLLHDFEVNVRESACGSNQPTVLARYDGCLAAHHRLRQALMRGLGPA